MARRLRETYRMVVILAILGVLQFSNYLSASGSHLSGKIALALVGSAVLAAVMGVLRAITVRIWRGDDNQLFRQGTWVTGVLWVVAVGLHLALDALVTHGTSSKDGNVGDATVVLYLAVSFGVQQVVLLRRATRMEAAGKLAPGPQVKVS
jgi:hypothetical protein